MKTYYEVRWKTFSTAPYQKNIYMEQETALTTFRRKKNAEIFKVSVHYTDKKPFIHKRWQKGAVTNDGIRFGKEMIA